MELGTQKKQENGGKQGRERQLNVIYFVDASKTHSFRMPLKSGLWLLGTLAVVVLWSVIGTVFLFREVAAANAQVTRIQSLLDTVFQYQTRYDGVYEKAYPKDWPDRKNQPALADSELFRDSDTPATKVSDGKLALAAKSPKKAASEADPKTPTPADLAVEIAEIKAVLKPSLLQVSFNMRNNRKPDLAAGTLWGVATYQGEGEQKKRFVTAPTGIQLRDDGETLNYRGGYRFSIRYFNSRTLMFPAPSVPGNFTLLRIYIADEKNEEIYVTVPLQVSEEHPEQSVAMPPHLPYKPSIRPVSVPPSSSDAVPQRTPKPSESAPKKSLTPSLETTDNGGKPLELIKGTDDEPMPLAQPKPEPQIEDDSATDSLPAIIEDGPSE